MKKFLYALALTAALYAPAYGTVASVYCEPQHIACGGGRYNPSGLTVAHKTLPCGTVVRITHGSRSVTATVNDRGPYVRGRDVDLSCGTARAIGVSGVAHVGMKVLSVGHRRRHA